VGKARERISRNQRPVSAGGGRLPNG